MGLAPFPQIFLSRLQVPECKGLENAKSAQAGVAQWIERQPANQEVAGHFPSQDTGLGFGPGPQLVVHKRQPHIDVSLPLFLPPISSKTNKQTNSL